MSATLARNIMEGPSKAVGRNRDKVKCGNREERKKYCLDYNKGTCTLQGPHEGNLNGVSVMKHHICKRCLIDDRVEKHHPSKDCVKK